MNKFFLIQIEQTNGKEIVVEVTVDSVFIQEMTINDFDNFLAGKPFTNKQGQVLTFLNVSQSQVIDKE